MRFDIEKNMRVLGFRRGPAVLERIYYALMFTRRKKKNIFLGVRDSSDYLFIYLLKYAFLQFTLNFYIGFYKSDLYKFGFVTLY